MSDYWKSINEFRREILMANREIYDSPSDRRRNKEVATYKINQRCGEFYWPKVKAALEIIAERKESDRMFAESEERRMKALDDMELEEYGPRD